MRIKDFGKIGNEIFDLLPAYLPAVVLFILMPFALYLSNQRALDSKLALVIPYLVLAIVYFVLFVAFLVFVGQPWRTRVVIVLFYIGVYLGLSDIVSPVQLGQLMGGRETPGEPLFLTIAEVILAVVVIFGAIKLPWKRVKRFASIFILLLLVSEAVVVFNGLSPETRSQFTKSTKNISNPPEKLADGGNIYHITLDGYNGAIFLESLEQVKLTEEFDGFTFFNKTRSNYETTEVSLPSYMTGTFYDENDSLKEWMVQHKSFGIVKNLYDAGYEISMYIPHEWYVNQKASHFETHEDVLSQYENPSPFFQFADLWLLRVVPNYLQQEVYREGKGIFTRLFVREELAGQDAEVFASVQLMRQLIDDEPKRPDHGQYIYAHIYVPHSPFVMNRDCIFSSAGVSYDEEVVYEEQVLCATRLMAELISKLKELGRYHDSTIIFQADHGWAVKIGCLDCEWDAIDPDCGMPLEVESKVDEANPGGIPARKVNPRTHALLLIKPPSNSGKPLVISNRPTQLADIPATVYDLLDLPVHAKEGISVFSPDFPEAREIHIFIGLMKRDAKTGRVEILHEGQICHLSFTNGRGWKIYSPIHVRWE